MRAKAVTVVTAGRSLCVFVQRARSGRAARARRAPLGWHVCRLRSCVLLRRMGRANHTHMSARDDVATRFEHQMSLYMIASHTQHRKNRTALYNGSFPGLNFLHIPKAAGSSIEEWAWQHGVFWGRHYDRGRYHSPSMRRIVRFLPKRDGEMCTTDSMVENQPSDGCCHWWHTPPRLIARRDPRVYLRAPYQFCVVRDPIDRLVSGYSDYVALEEKSHIGFCRRRTSRAAFRAEVRSLLERIERRQMQMHDCHFVRRRKFTLWRADGLLMTAGTFPNRCRRRSTSSRASLLYESFRLRLTWRLSRCAFRVRPAATSSSTSLTCRRSSRR